jgi:hypothetical protein
MHNGRHVLSSIPMKGNISKGQIGAVRDALAEIGSSADVKHVEGGSGWQVDMSGVSDGERRRIESRLAELGISTRKEAVAD